MVRAPTDARQRGTSDSNFFQTGRLGFAILYLLALSIVAFMVRLGYGNFQIHDRKQTLMLGLTKEGPAVLDKLFP